MTDLECLDLLYDCSQAMKEAPFSNWCEYVGNNKTQAENEAEFDLKLLDAYWQLKRLVKPQLTWDDLPNYLDKEVKVKLNNEVLDMIVNKDCFGDIYVQLYKEKEDGVCVDLLSDFFKNKELFNNLHLEIIKR